MRGELNSPKIRGRAWRRWRGAEQWRRERYGIKLLKLFGSPTKVFAASVDRLRVVEVVGPGTFASIHEALNTTPSRLRTTKCEDEVW